MSEQQNPSPPPKAEILVVEDSPTQAEQLKYLLEQQHFSVELAGNGHEALVKVRIKRPSMIITDIMMPEMDGYQLCTAVKSDPALKDIPVVVVTSLTGMQDIAKSLECGADNFLRKPYDPDVLLSRINYILLNEELRRERRVQMGMEVYLEGKRHFITSGREQIVDMLISTYEEAMHMYDELQTRQKEIARSNQTLRGLYRIAEALNHASSESEVCERALQGMVELPSFRAGWIFLRDEDNHYRTAGSWYMPDAAAWAGQTESKPCRCQQQLTSGEMSLQPTLVRCEHLLPSLDGDDSQCYHACVPLVMGDRMLGVMNLLPTEGVVLNDEDMKMLKAVANQVAVALERTALNVSLQLRASQLEAANRELESFSYTVSHDLRAPLRAIDGFSRMLQNEMEARLHDEDRRLLQVIRDNTVKMGQLIDDLLAFSRLGTAPLNARPVDMKELARQVYEELAPEREGKLVEFVLHDLPPAYGDPALLRQVWANLLGNAIKYTGHENRPVIEVIGIAANKENVYAVKDNGVGFDMRYYDKLFGVFQRLHSAEDFPGSGVGLANVQRIVARHGGRVWAEGKVGEGASFFFALQRTV
jgi:signal transduction histidine kinase/CheY-like chemotaxis protein